MISELMQVREIAIEDGTSNKAGACKIPLHHRVWHDRVLLKSIVGRKPEMQRHVVRDQDEVARRVSMSVPLDVFSFG